MQIFHDKHILSAVQDPEAYCHKIFEIFRETQTMKQYTAQ